MKHYMISLSYGDSIPWIGYVWAKDEAEAKSIMYSARYTNSVFSLDLCGGCPRCLMSGGNHADSQGIIKEDNLKEHQDVSSRG